MKVTLQIKNYRSFAAPIDITIKDGVTALVGTNNAGKSSLLRFLYDFRNLFTSLSNIAGGPFYNASCGHPQDFNSLIPEARLNDIFCKLNDEDLTFSLTFDLDDLDKDLLAQHTKIANQLLEAKQRNVPVQGRTLAWLRKAEIKIDRRRKWTAKIGVASFSLPSADGWSYKGGNSWPIYIPIDGNLPLINPGTLVSVSEAFSRSFYIPPYRHSVNQGETNSSLYDLKIGKAFILEWNQWKNGIDDKKHEAIRQVIELMRVTFGYKDLDINVSDNGESFYVTANGKRYDLRDIGAGFTQWLMILSNAAISRPTFILIDEPENHLHPSLQLKLLSALTQYAAKGVIFATHNYGLARSAVDYVYVIHKTDSTPRVEPLEKVRSLAELLGELSFSAWREIGVEKLLLVEGRTDAEVCRHFLRLMGQDAKVLVMSMGGGQVIGTNEAPFELDEIKRLGVPVYALIDSDREKAGDPPSGKAVNFQTFCKKAKIKCHILDRRTLENYFVTAAIKKAIDPSKSAIGEYEKIDERTHWRKKQNVEIALEMKLSDLEGTDLKEFLERI